MDGCDLGESEFGVEMGSQVAGGEDVEGDLEAAIVGEQGGHEGSAETLVTAIGDDSEVVHPTAEVLNGVGRNPANGAVVFDCGVESDLGVIHVEEFGFDLGFSVVGDADEFGIFGGLDSFNQRARGENCFGWFEGVERFGSKSFESMGFEVGEGFGLIFRCEEEGGEVSGTFKAFASGDVVLGVGVRGDEFGGASFGSVGLIMENPDVLVVEGWGVGVGAGSDLGESTGEYLYSHSKVNI